MWKVKYPELPVDLIIVNGDIEIVLADVIQVLIPKMVTTTSIGTDIDTGLSTMDKKMVIVFVIV